MSQHSFERLPPKYSAGTSKLLSRSDVRLKAGDDGAGDFIGRLVSLFGAPDPGGEFVFRHRVTGLVITAYAAQSGPSYGGGTRFDGALLERPPRRDDQMVVAQQRRRSDEVQALLGQKAELELQLLDRNRSPADVGKLHSKRRELARAISELTDPPGFYTVAEELEQLLAAAPLGDYKTVDDSSDFGPRWVGARTGEPFDEPLSFDEAMSHWLGLIDDKHPDLAGFYAIKLFFQFDGATPAARARWIPILRTTWMKLLAMVERRPDPNDLAALRGLLADFADKLEVPVEARERLGRASHVSGK